MVGLRALRITPPALVFSESVALPYSEPPSYEQRPHVGPQVLVTQSEGRAGELVRRLADSNLSPLHAVQGCIGHRRADNRPVSPINNGPKSVSALVNRGGALRASRS